jgi:hypothetical protein
MACAARATAETRFDVATMVNGYVEVLRKAAGS